MIYGECPLWGGKADIGISGRRVRDMPDKESTNQGQTNVESKVYLLTNRDPRRANFCISQVWRAKRANEKFSWSYHHGCPQPVKYG